MDGTQKPSLTLRRHLKAPVEKVFQAWTEPEALKRWFGPSDAMDVTVAEVDLRVGGRYRLVLKAPDGEEHRLSGTYREIAPNTKLAFTWAWESTPERESIVTVLLSTNGEGTDLTLIHEQFADEEARDRHHSGWSGSFDRMERYLR